jgi:hypothetical protein
MRTFIRSRLPWASPPYSCREQKLEWPGARLVSAPRFSARNAQPEEKANQITERPAIPLPTDEDKNHGSFELTRKKLYEAVWSHPVVQVARSWGISDVAIGKMCKRHNVPN